MNGLTTQTSYRHRDNICYCGHDIRQHNLDPVVLTNNVCFLCRTSTGSGGLGGSITNANKHYFTSVSQITPRAPFSSFLNNRRTQYYTVGNGTFFINATSGPAVASPGSLTFGINTIVSPLGAIIIPGMVIMIRPSNVQNYVQYRIIDVSNGGIAPCILAVDPAIYVNVPAGNNVRIYGLFGSSQGPGLTANNQRAG